MNKFQVVFVLLGLLSLAIIVWSMYALAFIVPTLSMPAAIFTGLIYIGCLVLNSHTLYKCITSIIDFKDLDL